jgi:hypothetical protein
MTDQEGPNEPPKLRVVKAKKPKRNGPLTMTRELYELAEDFWLRKSTRAPKDLINWGATHGLTKKVVQRLIYRGYEKQGWAPLRDRARLYDAQQDSNRRRADAEQARHEADEMARAKRDNVLVVRNLRALGMQVASRINNIIHAWPEVAAGAQLTDAEVRRKGLALQPAATALRAIATSLRDLSASEMTWIKETAPDKDEAGLDVTRQLLGITAEQWGDFARTGKLPPGLAPEALREMAKMGFQVGAPTA